MTTAKTFLLFTVGTWLQSTNGYGLTPFNATYCCQFALDWAVTYVTDTNAFNAMDPDITLSNNVLNAHYQMRQKLFNSYTDEIKANISSCVRNVTDKVIALAASKCSNLTTKSKPTLAACQLQLNMSPNDNPTLVNLLNTGWKTVMDGVSGVSTNVARNALCTKCQQVCPDIKTQCVPSVNKALVDSAKLTLVNDLRNIFAKEDSELGFNTNLRKE